MAVGLFQKLKNIGKKIWGGMRQVAAPLMKVAKPLVNQFQDVIPGGKFISKGLDFVDDKIVKPYMGSGSARLDKTFGAVAPHLQGFGTQLHDKIKFRQ